MYFWPEIALCFLEWVEFVPFYKSKETEEAKSFLMIVGLRVERVSAASSSDLQYIIWWLLKLKQLISKISGKLKILIVDWVSWWTEDSEDYVEVRTTVDL